MILVKLFGALSHISQRTVFVKSLKHLLWWFLASLSLPFYGTHIGVPNYSFVQNSAVQVSADKPILWWYRQSTAQDTVHTLCLCKYLNAFTILVFMLSDIRKVSSFIDTRHKQPWLIIIIARVNINHVWHSSIIFDIYLSSF